MTNSIKLGVLAAIISFSAHAEYTETNPPVASIQACEPFSKSVGSAVVYLINNQDNPRIDSSKVIEDNYRPISEQVNREAFSGIVTEQYNFYQKYVAKGTMLNLNTISQISTPILTACKKIFSNNTSASSNVTEQPSDTFTGKLVENPDIYSTPWINSKSIHSISQCKILSNSIVDAYSDIKSGRSADTDVYFRRVGNFMNRKEFDDSVKYLVDSTTQVNPQLKNGILMGFLSDCGRRFN